MPKAFFFITCTILLLTLSTVRADSAETGGLTARIKSRAADIDTFTCDFRQERHLKIFADPVVFKGRLLVDKPDRLRWEFRSPIPSVLILNGDQGIKCDPEGGQQTFSLNSDPLMSMLAGQLRSWLSGDYSHLRGQFEITEHEAPPELIITPDNHTSGGMFQEIRIRLDPESLHPSSLVIHESGGDRTLLHFSNYELNTTLPETLFRRCGEMAGDNDRD